ncbi:MAG: hypothetical protein EOO43_03495 [Flavobacterium sp.]|nr:MAG: hypothetical protein EOO43_03495 [Flavobacterium sp.]
MYYNFSNDTNDMNEEALGSLREVLNQYEILSSYHLSKESKRVIIGEKDFKCIFCQRSKPEVRFKSKAHALPQLIGNNTLFTHRECDICNAKFGRILESHFANFMHLDHLVAGMKGKEGHLKFKTQDALVVTDGANINWSKIPDENLKYDAEAGKMQIKQKVPTFIPVGVYKCLVKMALTTIPVERLSNFESTLEWLSEDSHTATNFSFKELPLIYGSSSTSDQVSEISAIVIERKDKTAVHQPRFMFRLTYRNFVFQIAIPLADQEDMKAWKNLPYIPNLLDLEHGFDRLNYIGLNFSSTEPFSGLVTTYTVIDLDKKEIVKATNKNNRNEK